MMKRPTVLITGGAGYVGSHTAWAVSEAGYDVILLDNLSRSPAFRQDNTVCLEGDILDREFLREVFAAHAIDAVIHLASLIDIRESFDDPGAFYRTNSTGTLNLTEAMRNAGVDRLIFSSSCAVYGLPESLPLGEEHPRLPVNPYGWSKYFAEQILSDMEKTWGLRSVILRYFNASGADPLARRGEEHMPESHLIPLVLRKALREDGRFAVFGDNYPTPDGTCIRDYIHVDDIARAHLLSLKHLESGGDSRIYNLGNGNGFSVLEIIRKAEAITGKEIPFEIMPPRPGDVPVLTGDAGRIRKDLGWKPELSDIRTIISTAWEWEKKRIGTSV